MKKLLALFLTMVLLLPVVGCDERTPPETNPSTQPTESTTPPETTLPPDTWETTVPPTTDEPVLSASDADLYIDEIAAQSLPSEEELAATRFEAWWGASWLGGTYKYGYIGESGTITVPGGELTIALPQEWVADSTIVCSYRSSYWELSLCSTQLLQAMAAQLKNTDIASVDRPMILAQLDSTYAVKIMAFGFDPHWTDLEALCKDYCYLGKDDTYTYVAMTPDGKARVQGTELFQYQIETLGEDTLRQLLHGIVITEDMAKEMITITNPMEE